MDAKDATGGSPLGNWRLPGLPRVVKVRLPVMSGGSRESKGWKQRKRDDGGWGGGMRTKTEAERGRGEVASHSREGYGSVVKRNPTKKFRESGQYCNLAKTQLSRPNFGTCFAQVG